MEAPAQAALRLLAVILGATGLGFALRHVFLPHPSARQIEALDGASVLAFSVIVVGLMAALNPAPLSGADRDALRAVLAAACPKATAAQVDAALAVMR